MLTILSLIFLAFVIPYTILRPFSFLQKMVVMAMVLGHLVLIFAWHFHVLTTTGLPIVIDVHNDCQKYYYATVDFQEASPFSVTIGSVRSQLDQSTNYGYPWVLAFLWTLTPYGILAIRLLKTALYFISLSCLARVWRREYGDRLTMWGFAFLGIIFTPALYYNFRNLKDGLILSLFIFLLAMLDTLLRPKERRAHPISAGWAICGWVTVLFLIFAISTIRHYAAAAVVAAIVMHGITASKLGIRTRVLLLVIVIVAGLIGLQTGIVSELLELGTTHAGSLSLWSGYGLLQAFLSPLPWGPVLEPYLAVFYWIYWALLPYTLYALIRHLRRNMTWHLYIYLIVAYLASGPIGDPPRKRLIVHPIMVSWVLAHLSLLRRPDDSWVADQDRDQFVKA